MAKAAWCTVAPMSGKENAPINITLPAHTGRLARNTTVTVTNKNGTKPSKAITVNQAGAAVTTTMDATKPDVPKTGGTVVINGTSNSSKLSWRFGIIVDGAYLPLMDFIRDIIGDGYIELTPGETLGPDVGRNEKNNFVATIILPESQFAVDVPLTLEITDDANTKKTCTFTYKAGASTLNVDKTTLNFNAGGGSQSVNVTSNDEWSVS